MDTLELSAPLTGGRDAIIRNQAIAVPCKKVDYEIDIGRDWGDHWLVLK
jgi:hypothetical protein